jgi:hypothetical protein
VFFHFVTVLIALALSTSAALAAVSRAPGATDAWQACHQAVVAAERQAGIPAELLWSIALVESGRWDRAAHAKAAWPWTINAEGRGSFHASKEAAIAEVVSLQAEGVRSIDVGCMQVNLRHHPDAFASLDDAFDPTANAAYAARFLRALHAETGSWEAAAGRYHSATAALGEAYRARVLAQWTGSGGDTEHLGERPRPTAAVSVPREPPLPNVFTVVPIDTERMARITAAWRARQGGGGAGGAVPELTGANVIRPAGTLVASAEPSPTIVRAGAFGQTAPRSAASRTVTLSTGALTTGAPRNPEAEAAFAQRRAQVLHEWRQSAAPPGSPAGGATVTILRGNAGG